MAPKGKGALVTRGPLAPAKSKLDHIHERRA